MLLSISILAAKLQCNLNLRINGGESMRAARLAWPWHAHSESIPNRLAVGVGNFSSIFFFEREACQHNDCQSGQRFKCQS